jgi:hypothetical protein
VAILQTNDIFKTELSEGQHRLSPEEIHKVQQVVYGITIDITELCSELNIPYMLTGYAQVYGKYNTTPYDKLKLDLTYIENYSVWMDIKILFLTFKILFQKENTEGVDQDQTTAIK